jgi:hypothetical protein
VEHEKFLRNRQQWNLSEDWGSDIGVEIWLQGTVKLRRKGTGEIVDPGRNSSHVQKGHGKGKRPEKSDQGQRGTWNLYKTDVRKEA